MGDAMTIVIQVDRQAAPSQLVKLTGVGAQIAEESCGQLWLRIDVADPDVAVRTDCVAGRRYVLQDDWLIQHGRQVASHRLDSNLVWRRLDDVLPIQLPPASMAGSVSSVQKMELRLVRGGQPMPPAAAIISLPRLKEWASGASELRLRRLRWAMRENEAIVVGSPLPPVEATYLVAMDSVLIPAGWRWSPAISASDLCGVFGVAGGQWLVWQANHVWSIVADDVLVTMRRASVRQALPTTGDAATTCAREGK